MGMAMSMGAVILAAGEKGKRYCLPNSTMLIHSHSVVQKVRRLTSRSLHAKSCVCAATVRHFRKAYRSDARAHYAGLRPQLYLTPQQAVEYGLVDDILTPR